MERQIWGNKMSQGVSVQEFDKYTDCQICHNTLSHCHCKCPYCGERDDCECALFDAATGGWKNLKKN